MNTSVNMGIVYITLTVNLSHRLFFFQLSVVWARRLLFSITVWQTTIPLATRCSCGCTVLYLSHYCVLLAICENRKVQSTEHPAALRLVGSHIFIDKIIMHFILLYSFIAFYPLSVERTITTTLLISSLYVVKKGGRRKYLPYNGLPYSW